MDPDTTGKPKIEIVSDEDWKSRVKAEDAALDQKLKEDVGTGSEKSAPPEKPDPTEAKPHAESTRPDSAQATLPAADFSVLTTMLATQAMVALGLIANPATDKSETQIELGRHFIDLLGALEEKTRGNLTADESEVLSATLHQLRMAYVEQLKK